jgi:hypothetical protein
VEKSIVLQKTGRGEKSILHITSQERSFLATPEIAKLLVQKTTKVDQHNYTVKSSYYKDFKTAVELDKDFELTWKEKNSCRY